MTRRSHVVSKWSLLFVFLGAVLMISAACLAPAATTAPAPTKEVVAVQEPTATAKPTKVPTKPPEPTATDEPTALPTDTPQPSATPDLTATAEADTNAILDEAGQQFLKDVAAYKIVPAGGEMWYYDPGPVDLEVSEYNSYNYQLLGDDMSMVNFILKTDVTWDSTSGLATCGLIFRSEKDIEKGAQYIFEALRLSGLPAWSASYYEFGNWQYNLTGDPQTTSKIKQESGSTNTYVIIANGQNYQIYINGLRVAVTDNSKRKDGYLGYYIWQESGSTTCSFGNTYVWALPNK